MEQVKEYEIYQKILKDAESGAEHGFCLGWHDGLDVARLNALLRKHLLMAWVPRLYDYQSEIFWIRIL